MNGKYRTVKEVAEIFGVTRQTVRVWTEKGILTKIKIGGKVLYKQEDIDKLEAYYE